MIRHAQSNTHTYQRSIWSIAILWFTFSSTFQSAYGQTPTIQDCLGAIPICTNIYTEEQAPTGTGNYPNEINPAFVCSSEESNSIWYTFTVNQSGNFGFELRPNVPSDDYDWALFNVTNARCEDLFNDESLLVSCNAAGDESAGRIVCNGPTGATGASTYDIQGPGCSFFPPDATQGFSRYNALIPVEAGDTYVLMVNNYTGSTDGYTINFGLSDAGVIDMAAPEIQSAVFPETCNEQLIRLTFSENIQCSSLRADLFRLTGPDGQDFDLSLASGNCNNGAEYSREFVLELSSDITENGTYTFTMIADGNNDLLDNCNNPAVPGEVQLTFEVTSPGVPSVDLGENIISCDGQPVTLNAAFPQSSYQWQDGSTDSTLTVTQSGIYAVTVTNACGEDTDQVDITLLDGPPTVELGSDTTLCAGSSLSLDAASERATYLWQDGATTPTYLITAPGTYQVTVTNDCGATTDEITVEFVRDEPQPNLGEDIVGCAGDSFLLDATSERATYQWQDGSTEPTFNATQAGTYSVTATNVCGETIDEINITLLDGPPLIELGPDTVLCDGSTLTLDAASEQATYQWQDGATDATYIVSTPGTYQVTVTNVCGPTTDEITVEFVRDEPQPNLGEDIVGCAGDSFLLDATSERATYQWQDGSTEPTFNATQAGTYSVTATNVCGETIDEINITLLDGPPVIELGPDTVLCDGSTLTLDAASEQATYQWQDGATDATYIVSTPGTYQVTVTNVCGPTTDEITVEFVRDEPQPNLGEDIVGCAGESFLLDATSERATYQWQDGSTEPTFNATQAGTYSVTATNVCGETIDEINITLLDGPPVIELGPDTVLCDGSTLTLDAASEQATYQWQDGATDATYIVSTPGTYQVTVTNVCGPTTDEITVEFVRDEPQPNLGEDIVGCAGNSFLLDATSERATYQWQDGSTEPTFNATQAGTYSVTATNVCGETIDEINITLLDGPPVVELGQDSVLCATDNFTLDVSSSNATYQWQDGATTPTYVITASGVYEVTVTNACGSTTDAVAYEVVSGPPRPNLGQDETACTGETFLLDATSERATYEWQDGSTGATFSVNQSGVYRVVATNVCGQGSDEIEFVFLDAPPVVDLGPDQIRCEGESLQLEAFNEEATYNWSTGATTPSITVSSTNTYSVSVSNACGQVSDAIEVNFLPRIEVDLGEEQYLCDETLTLDATTHEFATHRWQDGSTTPVYTASEPGLYVVEINSACETVIDSIRLLRCQLCNVYMPNAFSPNGDGQNDFFLPYASCELTDFSLRIFDRWGTLVFETNDPTAGWDGKSNGQELPVGVYIWSMQYTAIENGEPLSGKEHGDIAILR